MNNKRGRLAGLIIVGLWVVVTAYFAWLHTFVIKTFYLDEKVTLDNRQYIIQEIDAVNFERVFPDNFDFWPWNVLEKLPVRLQLPFYKLVNFYSRPRITYHDTWEVNVKGIAIPRLESTNENLESYIPGHMIGRAVQQSANADYSLFNTRGKYYSAEELDQPIILIFEDKSTGHKNEIKIVPRWQKQYYFMSSPAQMAEEPEDTARKFFALASQGRKQEALQLVVPENRKEFPWPPPVEIWNQLSPEDDLHFSLGRQENQSAGVVYALHIQSTGGSEIFSMNMVKNQNHYEIRDIK